VPRYSVGKVTALDMERRALEAAVWGIPIVSLDAIRRSLYRDARAQQGDIVYWSQPSDWKFAFRTSLALTRYVYVSINTRHGPAVLEVPPATGAIVTGAVADAWQAPLANVGVDGEDRGDGGRYLVLPPGYRGETPAGYRVIGSSTYNTYALLRIIPSSASDADVDRAIALLQRTRVYPLSQATFPPRQRHLDLGTRWLAGSVPSDETFFENLARMIDEEPVRDLVAIGHLKSLGFRTGQPFRPDTPTREVLSVAATQAHASFMQCAMQGVRWWPDRQWTLSVIAGPRTGFTYMTGDRLEVDERAMLFLVGTSTPKAFGHTTSFTGALRGIVDERLATTRPTRLRMPTRYWAASLHDQETAWFLRDAPNLTADRRITFFRFYSPRIAR
ncbi:MAG: DUF1254 domain-containing protein, partial [Gemmatimonadaceae bacterium]